MDSVPKETGTEPFGFESVKRSTVQERTRL